MPQFGKRVLNWGTIFASAWLVCAGMGNDSLAAAQKTAVPWLDTAGLDGSSGDATPPILEVLCARLAAFGLAGPMGMVPRWSPKRECRPVLLRFGSPNTPEPTSIFTTVRVGSEQMAGLPLIRFKVNALEPQTQDEAVALLVRAVRSILRSYGVEMPDGFAAALEKIESGTYSSGPARMKIATERGDTRRHNIFLAIQGPDVSEASADGTGGASDGL